MTSILGRISMIRFTGVSVNHHFHNLHRRWATKGDIPWSNHLHRTNQYNRIPLAMSSTRQWCSSLRWLTTSSSSSSLLSSSSGSWSVLTRWGTTLIPSIIPISIYFRSSSEGLWKIQWTWSTWWPSAPSTSPSSSRASKTLPSSARRERSFDWWERFPLMGKLQCYLEQSNAPQKQRRDTLIMKTIKPLPPRFGWCAFWGFSSWFDILQVFHHSCCIKTEQRGSLGMLKPFLCNIDHLHNCLHSQGFNPCSTPCSKLIRWVGTTKLPF